MPTITTAATPTTTTIGFIINPPFLLYKNYQKLFYLLRFLIKSPIPTTATAATATITIGFISLLLSFSLIYFHAVPSSKTSFVQLIYLMFMYICKTINHFSAQQIRCAKLPHSFTWLPSKLFARSQISYISSYLLSISGVTLLVFLAYVALYR